MHGGTRGCLLSFKSCLTFSTASLHLSLTMSRGSPCNSGTKEEEEQTTLINIIIAMKLSN